MACCGNDGYSLFSNADNNYGEKYHFDPNFNGPKTGRRPTDVVWLFIFSIFMLVWITFGIFVLTHNPNGFEMDIDIRPDSSDPTFEYLKRTWWYSFITILFATTICMVLIYTLRWVATPLVWGSIITSIALFFIGAIYFLVDSAEIPNDSDKQNDEIVAGVVFLVLGLIYSVMVCFLRHKIIVAIALIKEGSKAVGSIYSTVFFPILPLIFQLTFMIKGVCIALSLPTFVGQDAVALHVLLQLFNFFGFLWAFWFIKAFQSIVLSCTFATWYWTLNKEEVPFFILTSAVARTTRFHLGTAALGSVLIAAVQLICYIIRALNNNRYARVFRLCCNITEYVERIMKFLSKNAFIMVAIHGQPFCKSMRDAFNLLMRNIVSVYVVDRVTTLLFALYSISVAVGMGYLTYYFLPTSDQQIMMVPAFISGFGSLLVASAFFGVYSMAIDTLFLCFLEDCERNDGTELRPYYMSRSLMKVMHKNSDSLYPTI